MLHHYLRRHENVSQVGSWSFAPAADRSQGMLFQIMGPAPECDQERVALTHSTAFTLAEVLRKAAAATIPVAQTIPHPTAHINVRRQRGEDYVRVHMTGGVVGDDVTVLMAPYDALELARAIYDRTLQVQIDEISPPKAKSATVGS